MGQTGQNMMEAKTTRRTIDNKKSCLKSAWMLKWDTYSQPVLFNYDQSNQEYRSFTGACISLLALALTLVFMSQQIIVLLGYKGSVFTTTIVQNYLDESYEYSGDDFPIAISLIDLNEEDYVTKTGVTMQVSIREFSSEIADRDRKPTKRSV